MIPRPAQYLLRFDDLCPTMHRDRWQRCLPMVREFGLRPILSIIPDNRDEELNLSPPATEFWAEMRAMQAAGATIALHGYTHLCVRRGANMLPLHRRSEFSCMPESTQRRWIHDGLEILREKGLNPTVFAAPCHGFDRRTLNALRVEGIRLLSDGFARVPFKRGGITWIPQQLWGPEEKSKGLWTICVHSNFAHGYQVAELHSFIREHSAQFTSVERVLAEFYPGRLGLNERLHENLLMWRVQASRARRQRKMRSRNR